MSLRALDEVAFENAKISKTYNLLKVLRVETVSGVMSAEIGRNRSLFLLLLPVF